MPALAAGAGDRETTIRSEFGRHATGIDPGTTIEVRGVGRVPVR
jgi:hypothetical protein